MWQYNLYLYSLILNNSQPNIKELAKHFFQSAFFLLKLCFIHPAFYFSNCPCARSVSCHLDSWSMLNELQHIVSSLSIWRSIPNNQTVLAPFVSPVHNIISVFSCFFPSVTGIWLFAWCMDASQCGWLPLTSCPFIYGAHIIMAAYA